MSLPPPPPPEGAVAAQPGWASSVPTPPRRRRPSRAGYWVAAALAAVGVAVAGWAVWTGVAGFLAIADFPRVDVPGQAEVHLEAGSYTVYYETPGVAGDDALPVLDVAVEPIDGAQRVTLEPRLTSATYQLGGPLRTDGSPGPLEGRSVWQFQLDRAGSYLVSVSAEDDTAPPTAVAIGPGIGRGVVGMVLGVFAAFGLLAAAALTAGVTALVRHSRARGAPAGGPGPTPPTDARLS